MKTDNLYLWLPGEDGESGCLAALPSESGIGHEGLGTPLERLEGLLDGFAEAEGWARAHAEIFADAPDSIERLRYVPLVDDACFSRGAGAIVWDEPQADVPALESTGAPFNSGSVQVLTGEEVNSLLRVDLDEDARDWPSFGSGGLDGARMCIAFTPDGGGGVDCNLEFSIESPDQPGIWTYTSYVPLDEIREALAPVLQEMKEAEDGNPKP